MKRLALACTLLTGATLSAQTNTFPSSGSVGIGTTNPGYPLEISNPSSLSFAYQRTGVAAKKWGFNSDNYNTYWHNLTDGILALTISNSGNVGIGTTNPLAKLHVRSVGDGSQILWNGIFQNPVNEGSTGYGVGIRLQNGTPEDGPNEPHKWAGIAAVAGSTWSNQTDLALYTSSFNQGANATSAPVERLRILANSGNVGIGTITPGGKLQISSADVGDTKSYSTSNGFGLILDQYYSAASELGASYTRTADIVACTGDVSSSQIRFLTKPANANPAVALLIGSSGNVGIGTTNPTHKLAVNGTIKAKEVIVETTGWSDYVFADDYALQPLSEVEAHIKANKHLPGIPSAAQVTIEGVSVGELQAKLLAKIEELTLHQIAQQKLLTRQEALLETQSTTLAVQSRELESLRTEVRTLRDAAKP